MEAKPVETMMIYPTRFSPRERAWMMGTRDAVQRRFPMPPLRPDLREAYEAAYARASATPTQTNRPLTLLERVIRDRQN